MEEWNVSQWTRLTAAEFMLPFSAGVWQHGFEFQSRYIALRIRAGENTPVIRGAVWRLFHLSKSQEKSNPERRCRDIGFSFRRVRQVWKNGGCTGKMLCGVVHRDSEHRIVSATILIHSLKACGLTQGISLNTLLRIKFKTGG